MSPPYMIGRWPSCNRTTGVIGWTYQSPKTDSCVLSHREALMYNWFVPVATKGLVR